MSENTVKRKLKRPGILAITTVITIIVVTLCGVFAWYQMGELEAGILDVCATQQDAYVQLVLDQINLKENRDDEEIINDILSTLDSSSNKYWTFSKDRDMLFVKDIIETNRYKGLTTGSYYASDSANEFLESLMRDRVIHKSIVLNGKEYVASGVAFVYGEDDYRLCLLTNKDVLLNNNRFMEAEIELVLIVVFVLMALLVVSMMFARKVEKITLVIQSKDDTIKSLQGMVGHLNELVCQKEHYDTKYQLWSKDVIKDFFAKLKKKNVESVVVARIHCREERDRFKFLDEASVLLDKKILRFVLGENDFLLLFLQYNRVTAHKSLERFLDYGTSLMNIETVKLSGLDENDYLGKIELEVQNGH